MKGAIVQAAVVNRVEEQRCQSMCLSLHMLPLLYHNSCRRAIDPHSLHLRCTPHQHNETLRRVKGITNGFVYAHIPAEASLLIIPTRVCIRSKNGKCGGRGQAYQRKKLVLELQAEQTAREGGMPKASLPKKKKLGSRITRRTNCTGWGIAQGERRRHSEQRMRKTFSPNWQSTSNRHHACSPIAR